MQIIANINIFSICNKIVSWLTYVGIQLARWLDLGKTIPIESIDKVHRSHINFAHPDYETDKTLL
jgi:hypothetical protein